MNGTDSYIGGWCRDLPDHRDWTPQTAAVRKMLRSLPPLRGREARPSSIDWSKYCAPVADQAGLATGVAHACVALVQYFERRASGRLVDPSRLFLHANARRLAEDRADGCVGLRTALKAAEKFGLPPEQYWPYRADLLQVTPDAFAYAYPSRVRGMRYVRLDAATGERSLAALRSFLAAGFACALGFSLRGGLDGGADVAFPTLSDDVRGGQAVVAVGYDDELRIRSARGALLIRNSWGAAWGNDGYGWLPYRYITDQLAVDIWTVLKPRWLRAGDLYQPD
jgi:C1A family cysteine protease